MKENVNIYNLSSQIFEFQIIFSEIWLIYFKQTKTTDRISVYTLMCSCWTNSPISNKFGTNGPHVYRNRLAFSKIRIPPFPPSLRGGPCPSARGLLELMDRFRWNLAQIVLMYVGIDWHCQKFEIPPFPPPLRGGPCPPTGVLFELIDQFWWNLAKMVFTNVGMKWYCQIYQIVPVSHMKGGWGEHVPPKLRCI